MQFLNEHQKPSFLLLFRQTFGNHKIKLYFCAKIGTKTCTYYVPLSKCHNIYMKSFLEQV